MTQRRYLRDPLVWLLIATAALSLLGLFNIARELGTPFGGYISYRRAQVPTGEVDLNTPVWWSGLIHDRLVPGAILLAVDGLSYYPNARDVYRQAAEKGRRTVAVEFRRPGEQTPVMRNLSVERFGRIELLDIRLPDLIMATAFWLLAVVVYRSAPDDPTNRAFTLSMALVGLLRAIYVHSLFYDNALSTFLEVVILTTIPFFGVSLIVFASHFPVSTSHRWRAPIVVAGVFAAGVALCGVLAQLPVFSPEQLLTLARVNYFGIVVLFLLGMGALTGRLVWRLTQRPRLSRREKRIILVVLLGILFASPMLLTTTFSWVIIDGKRVSYFVRGLDLRYLALAVPLTFAYALVRYRSMRSPSLLFVFVMLLSFSAILAAAGAWAWTWNHTGWPANGLRPPFPSLFTIALISGLLWVLVASARGVLGRIFHYEQRAYGAVRDFGRRITAQADLHDLPTAIVAALTEELDLERAAIWLAGEDETTLALAGQAGWVRGSLPATLPLDATAGSHNANHRRAALSGAPLRIDPAGAPPGWLRPIAGGRRFEVALPLVGEDRLIGVIALGPRWDEGVFDDRDLDSAELIAQQAALFLVAAERVAELRRVPGRMADVQDRERERVAQELHDTVQQFLGRLPFHLAVGRDAAKTHPEQTREILDQAITDVGEAAATVRQIRHDLAPSQLERGLAVSVSELCRRFEQRTGIAVTVAIDPAIDALTTTPTRYALYRVIQQSLDNVESHAAATAVSVTLTSVGDAVTFAVSDNGRGSSEAERHAARERGSYGLESMRVRLVANGGEFRLESAPGRGMRVSGSVPASS